MPVTITNREQQDAAAARALARRAERNRPTRRLTATAETIVRLATTSPGLSRGELLDAARAAGCSKEPARAAIAEAIAVGALHTHRQGWGGGQRVHPGRSCAECAENNARTMY